VTVAVVIPTLDEERAIVRTLHTIRGGGKAAVIVVADCGSRDRTASLASREGVAVVVDPALDSRAAAMNAGAAKANALVPNLEVVWFLHADTQAPHGWHEAIVDVLQDPRVVGGAFRFQWDLTGTTRFDRVVLQFFALINRGRYALSRRYFGDQGIFVRAAALEQIGGVPDLSLMEDITLCRRLKRLGPLRTARASVITSPRRFLRHGVVRQAAIDALLLAAERLGLQPRRLHAWYNREKA
jgi:glycosyltransferase involved in cell wall biosynthesis